GRRRQRPVGWGERHRHPERRSGPRPLHQRRAPARVRANVAHAPGTVTSVTIEIRKPEPGEFEDLLRSAWPAFGGHADEDKEEFEAELLIHDPDRALGAVEQGRFVGELMGAGFELTIPGGVLPAAGVTSAGVLPTHRRRGLLSSLMKRNLEEVHERGEPLSVLHASEGPIYGRFGFGIATWVARLAIDRNRTGFVPGAPSPVGSIRFLDRDEALRSMPSVYDAIRPN